MELKSLLMCDASEGDAHKGSCDGFCHVMDVAPYRLDLQKREAFVIHRMPTYFIPFVEYEEHNPAEIEQAVKKDGNKMTSRQKSYYATPTDRKSTMPCW